MPASIWKGYISFGLVSFPVRLFAAARPDPIHFHMLHKKDSSRLKEVFYCIAENKPVTRDEIVSGFEYQKNRYVTIEPDELKKVAPKTATLMEIQSFVKAGDVDPIYFDKSYYVAPEERLTHPYSLLLAAMRQTERYAVAKIAMHDREHIIIIRPTETGMVAHTMYFETELHKASRPASAASKFDKKEMDMAARLIEALESPFKPESYHDEYRKNVERLIDQKRKGHEITVVPAPAVKPVNDIMEALRQSLEKGAAKKPAAKRKASAAKHKAKAA